jgi:hypothetical protein
LPVIIRIGLAGAVRGPDSSPSKIKEVKWRIPVEAGIILDAAGQDFFAEPKGAR